MTNLLNLTHTTKKILRSWHRAESPATLFAFRARGDYPALRVFCEAGSTFCRGNLVMRKLLISLGALVLVAFPVHAQTPAPQHGLKAGYITLVVTAEVLPGQMDNFRNFCQGWSQRWPPKNQGHSSMSGASIQTKRLTT